MKKIILIGIGYAVALVGMVATAWLPIELTAIAIGGGLLIGGDATARLVKEVSEQ